MSVRGGMGGGGEWRGGLGEGRGRAVVEVVHHVVLLYSCCTCGEGSARKGAGTKSGCKCGSPCCTVVLLLYMWGEERAKGGGDEEPLWMWFTMLYCCTAAVHMGS